MQDALGLPQRGMSKLGQVEANQATAGSSDLARQQVTAQAPGDALVIRFGITLTGRGRIEIRDARLTPEGPAAIASQPGGGQRNACCQDAERRTGSSGCPPTGPCADDTRVPIRR